MEQNLRGLILEATLFLSGSKSLGLDIWLILEARLFSHVLIVWDLTFGPDGAFGMDIHFLESWTPMRFCSVTLSGYLSQMLHLGQISSPRLLEPERLSLASKMSHL